MADTRKLTGQCICGDVKFSCAAPDELVLCHCKDCQRSSGAMSLAIFFTPSASFELIGETQHYTTTGEQMGLHIERNFCPRCGSQMFSRIRELDDRMIVKVGAIDDMPETPISAAIWTQSMSAPAFVPPGVPTFETSPPQA